MLSILKQRRLKKLKNFLDKELKDHEELYHGGRIQTFYTRSFFDEPGELIFTADNIFVLYSEHGYIEILGLYEDEILEMKKYGYNNLLDEKALETNKIQNGG